MPLLSSGVILRHTVPVGRETRLSQRVFAYELDSSVLIVAQLSNRLLVLDGYEPIHLKPLGEPTEEYSSSRNKNLLMNKLLMWLSNTENTTAMVLSYIGYSEQVKSKAVATGYTCIIHAPSLTFRRFAMTGKKSVYQYIPSTLFQAPIQVRFIVRTTYI